MVAALMSAIASSYSSANQASWIGTSFLLATCTFTPHYGRLCTVLGRRGAHQVAIIFASLGTLGCGVAPGMKWLIASRFLAGVGGGGLFVTTGIVTSDMYSMRDRSLTQGIASVVNCSGLGIGGYLGGVIMDRIGWRWAFLIQLPFFALSFLLTTTLLNYKTQGGSKSASDTLKRVDYGGAVTMLIFVGSILLLLSFRYNSGYEWSHPYVYVPLMTGILSLIAFVVVELFLAPEPVMPPFLLHQRIPILVGLNNVLVAVCNFSLTYFFPMWFETVKLTTASEAGAHIAPNSISMSLGSLFAGWYMHRTGKYKALNIIFGILPTIAAGYIVSLDERSNKWSQWLSIIPLGFGNSVVLQTTLIALLLSVDRYSMAVSIGFVQLFSGFGQVLGVAISSAIFQSLLGRELRSRLPGPGSEKLIEQIRESSEVIRQLPPELQRPVRDAYAVSLRAVFILAACCAFVAFLARFPIPELPMDQGDEDCNAASDLDQDGQRKASSGAPPPNSSRVPSPNIQTGGDVERDIRGRPIDLLDEDEEGERLGGDSSPIPIPSRPGFDRRLSTYQNTLMDVERGRSARRLRNSKPRESL
ncbi:hypothetical protein FRB91_010335 [Serendipita sp. 411]|nr:hypothetical protein FRB91_010335 [Serendipita sp. 411]